MSQGYPSEPSPFLEHALSLLERGISVFPLGGYGETPPQFFIDDNKGDVAAATKAWPKRPRIAWKPFQTALPTEDTVRSWWTHWPTANIGIACGELVVVDADSTDSAAWCRANLPPTPWRVKTSKGVHFYFRNNPFVEIRNSVDQNAKLDTRGLGGYVVAGGSVHHSGTRYVDEIDPTVSYVSVSDLPMLEQNHVEAIHVYRSGNIGVGMTGTRIGNLAGFDASKIRMPADGAPVAEGGRNNAAASLAGQHFRAGLSMRDTKKLLDSWNASNSEPLSDAELNTTIASVKQTHERNHPGQTIPLEPPPVPPAQSANKKKVSRFPSHLLVPPGLVGEIAAYITRTAIKPQPVLSLGASVALCATFMGRKVRTRSDIRTNPYVIAVADSGAGKEHPRKAIKLLLTEAGAISMLGAEDLASDAGLFSTISKTPSTLLLMDELGRFLRTANDDRAPPHLKNIMSMLMRLSGSADSSFIDKARAEHREIEALVIKNPNLVLFGTTVPGRLLQGLKKDDITDGFVPRFLLFHSDDPDPDKQWVTDKTPPPEMVKTIHEWFRRPINAYPKGDLDLVNPNPLQVDATPEAQLIFDAFEAQNRVRKARTRGTGIDAIWSRADEHAGRLALIVAAGCNFDSPLIDRVHAEWACEVVAFVLDRAIAEIDTGMAENEHEASIKKVLGFIAGKGSVTRSELLRKFRWLKSEALNGIVMTLGVGGTGELALRVGEGKPGCPETWIDFVPGRKE